MLDLMKLLGLWEFVAVAEAAEEAGGKQEAEGTPTSEEETKTEEDDPNSPKIPRARLNEVIAERNAEREKVKALESEKTKIKDEVSLDGEEEETKTETTTQVPADTTSTVEPTEVDNYLAPSIEKALKPFRDKQKEQDDKIAELEGENLNLVVTQAIKDLSPKYKEADTTAVRIRFNNLSDDKASPKNLEALMRQSHERETGKRDKWEKDYKDGKTESEEKQIEKPGGKGVTSAGKSPKTIEEAGNAAEEQYGQAKE